MVGVECGCIIYFNPRSPWGERLLLVIFVVFVLANMMLRPESYPDMKLSALLRMVLTFWNRKRRKMIEKISCLFKGLCTHFVSGCSICSGFARHIAKTVVQILKGGDSNKKS